jgi:hypothetical protein
LSFSMAALARGRTRSQIRFGVLLVAPLN